MMLLLLEFGLRVASVKMLLLLLLLLEFGLRLASVRVASVKTVSSVMRLSPALS